MAAPGDDKPKPMTRAELAVLLGLCALLVIGVAGRLMLDHFGGERLEQVMSSDRLPSYRVDINAADAAELAILPNIGPVRAERIVAWRREHGPFVSVDALANVPGLGEKTVAALKPYVIVSDK